MKTITDACSGQTAREMGTKLIAVNRRDQGLALSGKPFAAWVSIGTAPRTVLFV